MIGKVKALAPRLYKPAVRLYKKFGFEVEGTSVQFAYRDGQYGDVYTMARLKQEAK